MTTEQDAIERHARNELHKPEEWAKLCTPIPVLELEIRVAQLGGWDNVDVLTTTSTMYACSLRWSDTSESLSPYRRPDTRPTPDGWRVYAVRKSVGNGREEVA